MIELQIVTIQSRHSLCFCAGVLWRTCSVEVPVLSS